jgi:hypothetical protein
MHTKFLPQKKVYDKGVLGPLPITIQLSFYILGLQLDGKF